MPQFRLILDFLEELQAHNDREWFNDHKEAYLAAQDEMVSIISLLMPGIRKTDPTLAEMNPRDTLFRIYRDVRFSRDKSPYKTHFGAYVANGGRKSIRGGYYLHIQPGQSMAAGGIWQPGPNELKAIRQEIYYHLDEFRSIVENPVFVTTFGELTAEGRLSRPPKGYDPEFAGIEYLKNRSFTVLHRLSDEALLHPGVVDHLLDAFAKMAPLNAFLNRAVNMMDHA